MLSEMTHVLGQTYFAKEKVNTFFANLICNEKLSGTDPCGFWKKVNFLNIQQNGSSQNEIIKLFNISLLDRCWFETIRCGSPDGVYIYLDDVLFSGSRIKNDLKDWIIHRSPGKAVVHIIVIGTHLLGEWQCTESLKKIAAENSKDIEFHCWAAVRLENRKSNKNISEVLWPSEIPDDLYLSNYMAKETKFPFEPRIPIENKKHRIFKSENGRQLLERELLLAGVRILSKSQNPKPSMRPLGFGYFGLGFGSTIVTYRNCPNNCPLAFWWGDPTARSGPFHWYPLFPRKTYEQNTGNPLF